MAHDVPFRKGLPGGAARPSAFSAADRRAESPDSLPVDPACPFCGGDQTEIMNAFGAHASVSTYWCRACRSPFDFMKWR